jgi:hypothetical protein
MKKDKERIYIKAWSELKPYERQSRTDVYYLKLANDVKQAFLSNEEVFQLFMHLGQNQIDLLACFLVSYFEDLISDTNIWNTFVRLHRKFYGNPIPFYETSEYYEEEINIQDLSFLIWYFMNTVQSEQFFSPVNDFIIDSAALVMEIFDEAWDFAPENTLLQSFYQLDESQTDFYVVRNLIDTILFKTYLFYPDTAVDLHISEMSIIEDMKNDENLLGYLNENRDHTLHNAYTRLLGMKGNEWAGEILGGQHQLSQHLKQLSPKITGYFSYKGQDEENIFLEHIASGKKFNMTKKSFDHSHSLIEIDSIVHLGIVMWMDEWWFSGIFFTAPFNADLILDEKNSVASRNSVSFLDNLENEAEGVLADQLKAFKKFNKGSQIAFMKAEKVESFIKSFIEFYNKSLNRTEKDYDEAKARAREEGFFGNERKRDHHFDEMDNALVFFNPKGGTEIALEVTSAFPAENNPFFEIEESQQHIINLLT